MAIIDRIKFDGLISKNWIIYRYPGESYVMGTQLIVGEGQVAVFVKGGKALDYFTAGTYTLSTSNLPLLKGIVNLPFGGKTPFTAEVYFINKTVKLDMYWGTVDPIQVIDPKYKVKLRVRGFGQFGMRVEDYRVFMTELIGAMNEYEVVSFDKLMQFFKGLLVTKVKSIIADVIINRNISALEVSAHLEEISEFGREKISDEFERFGLKVVNFFVQSINFPDEDFETINSILKDKAAFDIMGDSRYVSKRSFDVMETAAQNEAGGGTLLSAGLGLGAGVAMGNTMGSMAGVMNTKTVTDTDDKGTSACPKCGYNNVKGSAFCGSCGEKLQPAKLKCPKCGDEVPSGMKFCTSCGSLMVVKKACSNCGTEYTQDSKFCRSCGKELEV